MQIHAPAKTNLDLRILGKRSDGFHEIDTLMVRLSLHDTLEIEKANGGGVQFTCSDPTIPAGSGNLVLRAIESFSARTGIAPDLRVHLQKSIPHGAGLGGGSSDAASTLMALNRIYEAGLSKADLSGIAAAIGSDIPFFIYESAARCRGRGEIVEPCSIRAGIPLVLIKPPFGVPTPWAYKQWSTSLPIPGIRYDSQPMEWGEMVNDLERPVFEKFIQLAEMKRWLLAQSGVAGAIMSGSGSTMVVVLRDSSGGAQVIRDVLEQFGPNLWAVAVDTV
ncbi:MAG: 4-(cytidine 5-diphospho)-2-C-methyl-D-erythritol kinase [Verrucomicrobiota bacterium]